jgi:hypothetical protein
MPGLWSLRGASSPGCTRILEFHAAAFPLANPSSLFIDLNSGISQVCSDRRNCCYMVVRRELRGLEYNIKIVSELVSAGCFAAVEGVFSLMNVVL